MLHRTKATLGDAYVIVGDIDETIGVPRVTCEDPRDTIGAADPIDRRTLVAALKVFIDDVAGVDRAYVYLAGEVHRATRPRAATGRSCRTTRRAGSGRSRSTSVTIGCRSCGSRTVRI